VIKWWWEVGKEKWQGYGVPLMKKRKRMLELAFGVSENLAHSSLLLFYEMSKLTLFLSPLSLSL